MNFSKSYLNKLKKEYINKLRSNFLIIISNELSTKNKKKKISMKINSISTSKLNKYYNNLEIKIKNPIEKGDSNRNGNYCINIEHINFNNSLIMEMPITNMININNNILNENETDFLKNRAKSIISKNKLKESNKSIKFKKYNSNNNIIITQNKERESLLYLRKLANLFRNYKLKINEKKTEDKNKKENEKENENENEKNDLESKQNNFKKNKSSNLFKDHNKIKSESFSTLLSKNLFKNKNKNKNNKNNNFLNVPNNFNFIDFNNSTDEKNNSNNNSKNYSIKHSSTINTETLKKKLLEETLFDIDDKKTIKTVKKNNKLKSNFLFNESDDSNENKIENFDKEEKINHKNKKKITRQELINKCLNFDNN